LSTYAGLRAPDCVFLSKGIRQFVRWLAKKRAALLRLKSGYRLLIHRSEGTKMRKWLIVVAIILSSGYLASQIGYAQQGLESLECRNSCSAFSGTVAELSGGSKGAAHSRSFGAFNRSCRRLCARDGVFSSAVLNGISESLGTLSSEDVRSIMAPPKSLPSPEKDKKEIDPQRKSRMTARAVASAIPSAIASPSYPRRGVGTF
jgi:hypothetical protein